jgi:ribosomal-protein-alanine N-acetyltransferase
MSFVIELSSPRDHERVEEMARDANQLLDVAAELERSWARLWVARETPGGVALGFLLAWSVADELQIVNVATHRDFRRRGVGRALVSFALETARRQGARLVLLEVRRSNQAAIALYRAHGFSVCNVRRAYYADDEDALEMMVAIDPETRELLPGADSDE